MDKGGMEFQGKTPILAHNPKITNIRANSNRPHINISAIFPILKSEYFLPARVRKHVNVIGFWVKIYGCLMEFIYFEPVLICADPIGRINCQPKYDDTLDTWIRSQLFRYIHIALVIYEVIPKDFPPGSLHWLHRHCV